MLYTLYTDRTFPLEEEKPDVEEGTDAAPQEPDQDHSPTRQAVHIRSLTDKMMTRPSPTVQNGIDELLQKLFEKYGGEAAGSNMFFSEGDEDDNKTEDDVSPTLRKADNRIRKKNSRRNVKHVTHSGVLSPSAAKALNINTASSEEEGQEGEGQEGS